MAPVQVRSSAVTTALPFVSVVIPVYNAAPWLRACLTALRNQTYPRDSYEVIVVDNGSTDGSLDIAAEFASVRTEFEREVGAYAARNRGIAVARGQILAFTDADCIPATDWIEKGAASLRRGACGLIGGAVELLYGSPREPTSFEIYEALFDFDQRHCVKRGRFAMTANLFTYATVVQDVGPFDGRLKSAADREWGNRVAAAGYGQLFVEDPIVRHPARRSLRALVAKRRRVAGGHHDRALYSDCPKTKLVVALGQQLILKPVRGAIRLWSARVPIGTMKKIKTLVVLIFLCYSEAFELLRLMAGGESSRV